MDDNVKLIESLLESTFKYGAAEIELIKLKTLNKTSDVVSSLIPHTVVFFILVLFLLFLNLGLAFWLGDIIGNNFCGFFVIAAFYAIVGLVMHFFMHKWIKRKICNYLVKQMFK
ncbi:phage holin family protein [Gaoshiqia sp. Z1-71]|uniref:phage holin family protein n=1 Tax=Gaoshiqia hydrogeniformans TaxID=3290090 RepID=UPI003BF88976